jgi:hypothetical protein
MPPHRTTDRCPTVKRDRSGVGHSTDAVRSGYVKRNGGAHPGRSGTVGILDYAVRMMGSVSPRGHAYEESSRHIASCARASLNAVAHIWRGRYSGARPPCKEFLIPSSYEGCYSVPHYRPGTRNSPQGPSLCEPASRRGCHCRDRPSCPEQCPMLSLWR